MLLVQSRYDGRAIDHKGKRMVTADQGTRNAASAILLITVLMLTGCAASAPGTADAADGAYPDVSLAETKSPVQLLRNSAASRIAPEVIDSVVETTDESRACLSAAEDPTGTVRYWVSGADIDVVRWHAWRVDEIAKILVGTFIETGWRTSTVAGDNGADATLLETNSSSAKIRVEAVGTEDDSAATIHITTEGPCVKTDGADSDEVKTLDGTG